MFISVRQVWLDNPAIPTGKFVLWDEDAKCQVAVYESEVPCDLAALLYNGAGVMMRRGWGVEQNERNNITWLVRGVDNYELRAMKGMPFSASDPFTALVNADRWYRENIERSEGS